MASTNDKYKLYQIGGHTVIRESVTVVPERTDWID